MAYTMRILPSLHARIITRLLVLVVVELQESSPRSVKQSIPSETMERLTGENMGRGIGARAEETDIYQARKEERRGGRRDIRD